MRNLPPKARFDRLHLLKLGIKMGLGVALFDLCGKTIRRSYLITPQYVIESILIGLFAGVVGIFLFARLQQTWINWLGKKNK